jgi:hypothetical protein
MPLQALLSLTSAPIAVEWADAQAGGASPSAQVVQAAVAAHEKCNDKSCPFCSLDPGSVQQAVLAFKQALEAAMKGQGPLPLIEIAQDASTISAAAAAMSASSSHSLLAAAGASGSTAAAAGATGAGPACSGSSAKQEQAAAAAAAAAASSQQLFARGGWMEVFRGKLGKAAAKLAGPAAAAAAAGSGGSSAAGDSQGLSSRDLLEVLGVRSAAGLAGTSEGQQMVGPAGQGVLEGAAGHDLQLGGLVRGSCYICVLSRTSCRTLCRIYSYV